MYNSIEISLTDAPLHLKKRISLDKNIHKQLRQKKNDYNTIIGKNIFKVISDRQNKILINKDESFEDITGLKATKLELKLLGTVAGENLKESFAVIQDKKKKEQSLYQVGQSVQGATVKKILRQKVILHYNGEDQVLEMDTLPDLNAVKEKN